MVNADTMAGDQLEAAIKTFFEERAVAYLHVHNARQGCYAARIDRIT